MPIRGTENPNIIHGIKSVYLHDYYPNFIADCQKHLILWQKTDDDIYGRIQTFLILIAKIEYHHFNCYCCIYPHSTSSEYTVFVDIDARKSYILLTTIRDSNFHPHDGRRIHTLKNELLFLNTSEQDLIIVHQEMPC